MNRDPNDKVNLERRQELRHEAEACRRHQAESHLRSTQQSMTLVWDHDEYCLADRRTGNPPGDAVCVAFIGG